MSDDRAVITIIERVTGNTLLYIANCLNRNWIAFMRLN